MPNALTRVPERPVPPLPPPVRALMPVADAFMVVMVSRPATGSLRDTWVTPATLWLAAGAAVVTVLSTVLLAGTRSVPGTLAAVLTALLAFGCASVVVVGVAQRASR